LPPWIDELADAAQVFVKNSQPESRPQQELARRADGTFPAGAQTPGPIRTYYRGLLRELVYQALAD
jgi:hypothetical protein